MPSFKARTRDCPMGMIESSATAPNFEALLTELNSLQVSSESIYRWVESDDPIFRRNRFQATITFPFIALLIADKPDIPMHMAIAATIDRGDPLIETLSSFVGVKKSSVRFLRGKPPALIGKAWLDCPSELFVAIDLVAPEKLPRTPEEWRLFHALWTGCRQIIGPSYLESVPDRRLRTAITRHMLSSLCSCGITKTTGRILRMLNGDLSRLQGVQDYFRFVGELHELTACLDERTDIEAAQCPDLPDQWPLTLHAAYSRREILTAVGWMDATRRPPSQSGVLALHDARIEILLVTLDKKEGFHERVAYHDYAISPELFHWQTQNTAGPNTPVGRRYSESSTNGWRFQLFVRETRDDPYIALGPVSLESEPTGDRPMSITWRLQVHMPLSLFRRFSVLRN